MNNNNLGASTIGWCLGLLLCLVGTQLRAENIPIKYEVNTYDPALSITNSPEVVFRLTFLEKVASFDKDDIEIVTSNRNSASVTKVTALPNVDGKAFLIAVSSNVLAGKEDSITIKIAKEASVFNAKGENITLAFNGGLSSYLIDRIPPPAPIYTGKPYIIDNDQILIGNAEEKSFVFARGFLGNLLCKAETDDQNDVDDQGDWTCEINVGIGNQSIQLHSVDQAGNVSTTSTFNVTVLKAQGDEDNDGLSNETENTINTNPYSKDSDGDGVDDKVEVGDDSAQPKKTTASDLIDALTPLNDSDDDGLSNKEEQAFSSDPLKVDTDGDGLGDAIEFAQKTDPNKVDTDGDGINDKEELEVTKTNPLKADTDDDGINDKDEVEVIKTDPNKADTNNDGIKDGDGDLDNDGLTNKIELLLQTDPNNADTDSDGVDDKTEVGDDATQPMKTTDGDVIDALTPLNDSDNDGLSNKEEQAFSSDPLKVDTDGDGLSDATEFDQKTDPNKVDTDGDGINDKEELEVTKTNPLKTDTDDDGINDKDEVEVIKTDPNKADTNNDGIKDGDGDLDNDGLTNKIELLLQTDPNNADSDSDGVDDKTEVGDDVTQPMKTTDGDVIDALTPLNDSDNDGLSNQEEQKRGTEPLKADSDGDGMSDKDEVQQGRDPLVDDSDQDPDQDGLSTADEKKLGLDPNNADTDNDGVDDKTEVGDDITQPLNTTGTTLIDARTPFNDSDNDGLHNIKEADLGTNPLKADTDGDGMSDKEEVDKGRDPLVYDPPVPDNPVADDFDPDQDGLSTMDEEALGLDPRNPDTDGDGIKDGDEDYDNDGLSNAVELMIAGTTYSEQGADPKNPDTDGDGIKDGDEDHDSDSLSSKFEVSATGTDPADPFSSGQVDGDADLDNDGLSNFSEMVYGLDPRNPDTDGDGIKDGDDLDFDNDGVPNADELRERPDTDADKDGVFSYIDDDDNDANIGDDDHRMEYWYDSDLDGIPNVTDPDDDNDGIPTKKEGRQDEDSDSIPDYLESAVLDTDGDGLVDSMDSDDDNDGIPTKAELKNYRVIELWTKDDDKDGIPDHLDKDANNTAKMDDGSGDSNQNGISDLVECPRGYVCPDDNKNGIPNYMDTSIDTVKDADNDGLTDEEEAKAGTDPNKADTDGDGLNDKEELQTYNTDPLKADTDGDGLTDKEEVDQGRNPLIPEPASDDFDPDKDGISTSDEQRLGLNPYSDDSDNNGIKDGDDDLDKDGLSNKDELRLNTDPLKADTDNDGVDDKTEVGDDVNNPLKTTQSDFIDALTEWNDSDGDGLSNAVEAIINADPRFSSDPLNPDTDGDGIRDGAEDHDEDGLTSEFEVKNGTNPINKFSGGSTISDDEQDNDNDGASNETEMIYGLDPRNPDTDGDGIKDGEDEDYDNDGILNVDEFIQDPRIDKDNDGFMSYLDDDDNNKNVGNRDQRMERWFDFDLDGIPNVMDADDDNDGIPTILEGKLDQDSDGIPDYLESNKADTDGDKILNVYDIDDDNDGIPTVNEIVSSVSRLMKDADHDGIPDYLDKDTTNLAGMEDGSGDSDLNGLSDLIECPRGYVCLDTDNNGVPDYLDPDNDGDGLSDLAEIGGNPAQPLDTNANGIRDYMEFSSKVQDTQDTKETPVDAKTSISGSGSTSIGLNILLFLLWFVWFARSYCYKMLLCILLLLGATTVSAEDILSYNPNWYVGGGIGGAKLTPETENGWEVSKGSDLSKEAYLGLEINNQIGVEGYINDLGSAKVKKGETQGSVDYQTYGVNLIYSPVQYENIQPFAKIGAAKLQTQSNDVNLKQLNDVSASFGLGAEYILNNNMRIRAGVDSFDKDAKQFTVGLNWRLDEKRNKPVPVPRAVPIARPIPVPPVQVQVLPAPIINTPPPKPAINVVMPPRKPAPKPTVINKTLSGGTNFDSNSSILKESGKRILARLARDLQKGNLSISNIVITGHTDSVGSDSANKRLSMQRAEAVRNYLTYLGIDSRVMMAIGKGEEQPLADNNTIIGRARNRRVELQVWVSQLMMNN